MQNPRISSRWISPGNAQSNAPEIVPVRKEELPKAISRRDQRPIPVQGMQRGSYVLGSAGHRTLPSSASPFAGDNLLIQPDVDVAGSG